MSYTTPWGIGGAMRKRKIYTTSNATDADLIADHLRSICITQNHARFITEDKEVYCMSEISDQEFISLNYVAGAWAEGYWTALNVHRQ